MEPAQILLFPRVQCKELAMDARDQVEYPSEALQGREHMPGSRASP